MILWKMQEEFYDALVICPLREKVHDDAQKGQMSHYLQIFLCEREMMVKFIALLLRTTASEVLGCGVNKSRGRPS